VLALRVRKLEYGSIGGTHTAKPGRTSAVCESNKASSKPDVFSNRRSVPT